MKPRKLAPTISVVLVAALAGYFAASFAWAQQMIDPIPYGWAKGILWDYDSGWVPMSPGSATPFTHNLGGDPGEYFVYIVGREMPTLKTHQQYQGDANNFGDAGVTWTEADAQQILLLRGAYDDMHSDPKWEEVRVRILKNQ